MMHRITVPWSVWYENTGQELSFPDAWRVERADMADAPELSEDDLRKAFQNPIGTPTLSELARGRKTAAIAVDDLTRPTQAANIMSIVLDELNRGGIGDDDIVVVMAIGSHRPLVRQDLLKKLGEDAVRRLRVYNHCPYDNLVSLGTSPAGSPIAVNKFFMEADLKIAVGFIVPHGDAGWGGGGKMIMPGVCGIETLTSVHGEQSKRRKSVMAVLEGNEMRADVEAIARKAGLDIIVNAVGNSQGQSAGLFVGDLVDAHRAGVELAKKIYATHSPQNIDVGVFNSFPEDTEFLQCLKAINIWADPDQELVRKGGTIVITTAATEGHGCHYLMDMGMRLHIKPYQHPAWANKLKDRRIVLFSPNITAADVRDGYPPGTHLFHEWDPLLKALSEWHGENTHAVVFPCCSLQYLKQ